MTAMYASYDTASQFGVASGSSGSSPANKAQSYYYQPPPPVNGQQQQHEPVGPAPFYTFGSAVTSPSTAAGLVSPSAFMNSSPVSPHRVTPKQQQHHRDDDLPEQDAKPSSRSYTQRELESAEDGQPSSNRRRTSTNGDDLDDGSVDFSQTFYDPFRIKTRRRTTPAQLKILEFHFARNTKPDVNVRKMLSEQLSMTPREVQVWFQNRRAKTKKQKEKAEKDGVEWEETSPSQPMHTHGSSSSSDSPFQYQPHSNSSGSSSESVPTRKSIAEIPIQGQYYQPTSHAHESYAHLRRGSSPAALSGPYGYQQPQQSYYQPQTVQVDYTQLYESRTTMHLPLHSAPDPASSLYGRRTSLAPIPSPNSGLTPSPPLVSMPSTSPQATQNGDRGYGQSAPSYQSTWVSQQQAMSQNDYYSAPGSEGFISPASLTLSTRPNGSGSTSSHTSPVSASFPTPIEGVDDYSPASSIPEDPVSSAATTSSSSNAGQFAYSVDANGTVTQPVYMSHYHKQPSEESLHRPGSYSSLAQFSSADSTASSSTTMSNFPDGFDPARRSSCPAEFYQSFGHLGLGGGHAPNGWQQGQEQPAAPQSHGFFSVGQPGQSQPGQQQQPGAMPPPPLSYFQQLHGPAAGARRGSSASMMLGTIAEQPSAYKSGPADEEYGADPNLLARRARSQANLRQMRPPMLSGM